MRGDFGEVIFRRAVPERRWLPPLLLVRWNNARRNGSAVECAGIWRVAPENNFAGHLAVPGEAARKKRMTRVKTIKSYYAVEFYTPGQAAQDCR